MTSYLLLVLALGVGVRGAPGTTQIVPVVNMTDSWGAPIPTDTMANRDRITGPAVTQSVADLIAHSCIFSQDNMFLRRVANAETQDGLSTRTFSNPTYHGGIWRVDESMFYGTQANTPALRVMYQGIRQKFGIDWMSVQWRDLEKPLYSGLASALYIAIQEAHVPLSTEEQGTYLQNHYHASNSANNYTRSAGLIQTACDGNEHADVVFLLDATITDENFQRMREYVRSVVQGFALRQDRVKVSVYQFGGGSVVRNFDFDSYPDRNQLLSVVQNLPHVSLPQSNPTTGRALETVLSDITSSRPNAAKIVVVVTDSHSSDTFAEMQSAGARALQEGVSVITVGVGNAVSSSAELDALSTQPHCTHHLNIPDFRNLKDIVQLTQHTICLEPMIARGMVRCRFPDCRNVMFPMTSNTMTVITNVTCNDGNVYVTTRTPRPSTGFTDFKGYVQDRGEPVYVTVADAAHAGEFIFAQFFGSNPRADTTCEAIISVVNGMIDFTPQCTESWVYPSYNPCLTPGRRETDDKFVYPANDGMFIQCDLRNRMYLTKCPPGEPYFHPSCKYCVGADSPALGDCSTPAVDNGYCGLTANPCTRENIEKGLFYFACPGDETKYLQCNTWGHAFVRSCQTNFVWREVALTCEYQRPGLQNPCHPGQNFYPYPADPHYYIQCNDLVPNLMPCPMDFVWDAPDETCVPPTWSTVAVNHVTNYVTLPPAGFFTTHPPSGGGTVGPNGLLSNGWVAPCTRENVAAMRLYFPYSGHPQQYIQCDLWGDAFVRNCQAGMYFNALSSTCVDGPVTNDLVGKRK